MRPATRVAGQGLSPIRRMAVGAPPGTISLGLGEPGWPLPAPAREALAAAGMSSGPLPYGPNGGIPALRYLTLIEDEEPADESDPLLTADARVMLDLLEPNERLRLNECGVLTREELRAYYFLSN